MIIYQDAAALGRKNELIGFKWLSRDGRKWKQTGEFFDRYDGWVHGPNEVAIEWKFRNKGYNQIPAIWIDKKKRDDLLALKEFFKSVFFITVLKGMAYYVEIAQIKGEFPSTNYVRPEREGDPNAESTILKIPKTEFLYLGFIEGVKYE